MSGKEAELMPIGQLHTGFSGPIVIMVCRHWDAITVKKSYISTDYIMSDVNGNVVHSFAKSSIAPRFKQILKDGGVYMLKGFTVVTNPEMYRIMKDSEYIIELQGSTVVSKVTTDVGNFNRYPFNLVPFEKLVPTDNKYFVDVIGYVTIVGKPSMRSTGSQAVEFNLTDERGEHHRVTLWGKLGDAMIDKKRRHHGVYVVLLTGMNVRDYFGNLCLSSTSATLLIDDANIPVIHQFKQAMSGIEVVDTGLPMLQVKPTIKTLRQLLDWGRSKGKREVGAFQGSVEITDIRTRLSWYIYTCTIAKCRKGVTSNDNNGGFKCDSCDKDVKYPCPRYRIQAVITNGTADVVVTLFDEPAEKLVSALLAEAEKDETGDALVLPPVLRDLIGSRHVFEIKSQTYYHASDYESFNCSDVVVPVPETAEGKKVGDNEFKGNWEFGNSSSKALDGVQPVGTPAKKKEDQIKIFADDPEDSVLANEAENDSCLRKRSLEDPASTGAAKRGKA